MTPGNLLVLERGAYHNFTVVIKPTQELNSFLYIHSYEYPQTD